MAVCERERYLQDLDKGWFDDDKEDEESQAAREFRENQEHHQMSQAWKDELTRS